MNDDLLDGTLGTFFAEFQDELERGVVCYNEGNPIRHGRGIHLDVLNADVEQATHEIGNVLAEV